jgi:hypothetical protein
MLLYQLLHIAFQLLFALGLLAALIQQLKYARYLWGQIFKPREFGFRYTEPPQRKLRGKVSHSYRNDPKNRQLQSDLLALVHHDVPTAKRLLQYQRQMNPGKSDNWYLEKVIWDLERDRGR